MELSNQDLMRVKGGGYGVWAILGGIFTFLISAIEGFLNPIECNS